ncbi:major_cap_HK97, phage major capsid protein, HK97 family [uncultured Caudovirales phage]|uniref:Major_cap_HK97, phage major capsid protein, HK97 family n=1 Tax=uncultured Caudovirales phage TaxID=2100421 RepID=A0A6J5MCE7_9CAUD|nr:major_cap_HK97, phage major capsid protein, HK97 family [uncultured Caudovirales phage]
MTLEEILALLDALAANPNATPEEMAATLAQVRDALLALTQPSDNGDNSAPQGDTLTAEQTLAITEKITKLDNIRKKKLAARAAIAGIKSADWSAPANALPTGTKTGNASPKIEVKSRHNAKHFKSNEDAFKVGKFLRAVSGDQASYQWCQDNGIAVKTMSEGNDISAGILVPEVWEDAIWNLKEPRGIARQYARIVPMNSPVTKRIKFQGGANTYFVGEGVAPTASDLQYGFTSLTAKKLGHLQYVTYELADDALVNVVDEITREAAYALSDKEDQCLFLGDATSNFGGVTGLRSAYQFLVEQAGGTWATDADKAKLASAVVGATNAWSGITRDNISSLRGKVRQGQGNDYAYFCSSQFYFDVMGKLAYAAGGVTGTEIVNGVPQERFDGYPVVFVETMPAETATNDIPLYFGSMSNAVDFGDLKATTVETDKNIRTQIWEIVTTERFDINVHDVGNYNATAANRKRGSLAALITKN